MAAHTSTARRIPAVSTADGLLPIALRLDALVSGVNGVVYLTLAGPLADLFDVPSSALRGIGAFLLAYAAVLTLVAASARPSPAATLAIAAGNGLWVVASVALVAFDWFSPSSIGAGWVVVQAGVVALFAALQIVGLRRN